MNDMHKVLKNYVQSERHWKSKKRGYTRTGHGRMGQIEGAIHEIFHDWTYFLVHSQSHSNNHWTVPIILMPLSQKQT